MRKYTTLILLLLIIIPVSGFSFWKATPEDVLIKFLKQNNLDDPFRREMAKITSSLNKYEINGTEINEDSAVVDIKITKPNMSRVFAEIFGPFHGSKDMKNPQEAARHMLRQYLRKADVPMAEERGNFTLVKEEGKWKVLLNPENSKQ
jgi:hypothetical protein